MQMKNIQAARSPPLYQSRNKKVLIMILSLINSPTGGMGGKKITESVNKQSVIKSDEQIKKLSNLILTMWWIKY